MAPIHAKPAVDSCMTVIDEHAIGILYEGSQAAMMFQRIRVEEPLKSELGGRRPTEE